MSPEAPFAERYALLPPEQATYQALGHQPRRREDNISQVPHCSQHASVVCSKCLAISPDLQEALLCLPHSQVCYNIILMSSRCNRGRLHGVHTRYCPVPRPLTSCRWTPSSQSGAVQAAKCSPWKASSKERASLQVALQQLRSVIVPCCKDGAVSFDVSPAQMSTMGLQHLRCVYSNRA